MAGKESKAGPAPASGGNPKVDFYFGKAERWREELAALREIALACRLAEVLKWGVPCYADGGNNIVLIHAFKDYCAFLFFKGVLLKDPRGILVQQTKHVQAARQIRFTNAREIAGMERTLKAYIRQAIEVEKAGLEVPLKATGDFAVAPEFQAKLEKNAALNAAFKALTPGRQRAYLLHFSQAKQSKTREARVGKYAKRILEGKGLDDQ